MTADPQSKTIPGTHPAKTPLTSRHVVLDNPYDSATIDRVIWDAVQENLQDLPDDEKLVVLISERHDMPAHSLAQAGLLTNLANWRDSASETENREILFTYETPYNHLAVYATLIYGLHMPWEIYENFHEHDPDGEILLKAILGFNSFKQAPQAKNHVFQAALRHHITTCFNDAARDIRHQLMPFDPVARKIAADEHGIDLGQKNISASGNKKGMSIRNATMVARALAKAEEKNARVIVQQCGINHLYGNKRERYDYEQSLTARFNRQARCRTLGVFFEIPALFKIPGLGQTAKNQIAAKAFKENPHDVIFANAAATVHLNSDYPAEESFIKRLTDSYRPERCPYAVDDSMTSAPEARALLVDALAKARPS